MNCPNCGATLPARAKFCGSCGAKIAVVRPEAASRQTQPQIPEEPSAREVFPANPYTGFSGMTDSEPVRRALKKQKRAVLISGIVLILAPLIGFTIYGAISDSMEIGAAFAYGLVISVIFAVIMLIVTLRNAARRPFEGTVSEMRIIRRAGNARQRGGRSRTKHLIWFACEDGRRRKRDVPAAVYNYLKNGDRVRYLPKFPQPYEKYKTASDTETVCMFCSRRNSLANENCEFCHNPLIR